MTKTLRPYQQEALDSLRKKLKETTDPLLVTASVGSGKSLILSELLLDIERAGWRALCLTMNSTLIQQNAETYRLQGGHPGVYCAALKSANIESPVIFASPHSVAKGIAEHWYRKKPIMNVPFNLIIIDECHNVNFKDSKTMYMRILNHYGYQAQLNERKFRIVGLTGTPFRGKNQSIVGADQLFKHEVCNITTSWLVDNKFLVKPSFGLKSVDSIDFSDCKINSMGVFKNQDLENAIHKNERLTGEIMREVALIVAKKYHGAFIFAATKKHCEECAASLPVGEWAIIVGETPHEQRQEILDAARCGEIKYLISVNCLNVGVDVPNFDVAVWVRPTESLIVYTQGIGRVLRLHPGKQTALVLDYAGNLERHGDIDNAIINEALKPTKENEKEYVIPCFVCGTHNTIHARRCIGVADDKRCENFFQFLACEGCGTLNDVTSRACRECFCELIDPNLKLQEEALHFRKLVVDVAYVESFVYEDSSGRLHFETFYSSKQHPYNFIENYILSTKKAKDVFYHKYIKLHHPKPSDVYKKLGDKLYLKNLIDNKILLNPIKLAYIKVNGKLKITEKYFNNVIMGPDGSLGVEMWPIYTESRVDTKKYLARYLCKNDTGYVWINDNVDFDHKYPETIRVDDNNQIISRSQVMVKEDSYTGYIDQYILREVDYWHVIGMKEDKHPYGDSLHVKGIGFLNHRNQYSDVDRPHIIQFYIQKNKMKHIYALFKKDEVEKFEAWSHNRFINIQQVVLRNGSIIEHSEIYNDAYK